MGTFIREEGKVGYFLMAILCELWRKQPLPSSDSVIKRVILEKCFLVWKVAPSKAQSFTFVFVVCGSLPLAKVSLNQQILQLCFLEISNKYCLVSFGSRHSVMLSSPTLVLVLCFSLLTDTCRAGWKETSDSSDPVPPLSAPKPLFPASGLQPLCSLLLWCLQRRQNSCSYFRALKISV